MRKEEKLLFFAGWKTILNRDFARTFFHDPAMSIALVCGMSAISIIGLTTLALVPTVERKRRF